MSALEATPAWQYFRDAARRPNAGTIGLARALDQARLDPQLVDLVDLLTCKLNGCAFYSQYRRYVAGRLGLDARKVEALPSWRLSDAFSPAEQAALAWAEALTAAHREPALAPTLAQAELRFTTEQLAFLSAAIAAMAIWNRSGIALQFAPLRAR